MAVMMQAQHAVSRDRSQPAMSPAGRPRAAGPDALLGNQAHLRRLSPAPVALQARLTVGAVDDPLEREADAVADQVMRMPAHAIVPSATPRVSRKCASCESEEKRKLRAKREGTRLTGGEVPESVNEVLRSSGEALDSTARQFFEPRFGANFSGVRVHHDARAVQSASDVQAKAYTVGNRIVFADNNYAPSGQAGRYLLAHELAHVVQQGASPRLRRSNDLEGRDAPPDNVMALGDRNLAAARLQRVQCEEFNNESKAVCEAQKCVTRGGADGKCRKTGMEVCACFPSRYWAREMLPAWVLALLSAAAIAAIAACFASGACEFGAVVAGLGSAAAAAVMAVLKAAGIRDSGVGAGVVSADSTSAPEPDAPQQAASQQNVDQVALS
jgi:hypothetical protein